MPRIIQAPTRVLQPIRVTILATKRMLPGNIRLLKWTITVQAFHQAQLTSKPVTQWSLKIKVIPTFGQLPTRTQHILIILALTRLALLLQEKFTSLYLLKSGLGVTIII